MAYEFATFAEVDEATAVALLAETKESEIRATLNTAADWESDDVAPVVTELLYYALSVCREASMGPEKTSVLLGLLLRRVRGDAASFATTADASHGLFRESLLRHSVERPPLSVGILEEEDASRFLDWATVAYYRSFHLYKHALARRPRLQLRQAAPGGVEPPRRAAPLREAQRVA